MLAQVGKGFGVGSKRQVLEKRSQGVYKGVNQCERWLQKGVPSIRFPSTLGLVSRVYRLGLNFFRRSTTPECCLDVMSRALHRAARSPFLGDIEWAPMPSRFTRPPFNSYDGKTDLAEHVSHYIQMMSWHSHNDALMCKVFPSSLGPTILRWFNRLRKGSIHNFVELIQEFGVQFMTCNRVP